MINETTSTSAAQQAAGASSLTGAGPLASSSLDREDFLKLLVTQLQNQDPTNPLDGHEFAAQLAQFSSVEQLINIGEKINETNAANQTLAQGINSGVAAGLIGKEVDALSSELGWAGDDVTFGFELPTSASEVSIKIRNAAGEVVRTLEAKNVPAGTREFIWNGRSDAGEKLPEGAYAFEVTASDSAGEPLKTESSFTRGHVSSINFGPDGIQISIDGVRVPMSAVYNVREASSAGAAPPASASTDTSTNYVSF